MTFSRAYATSWGCHDGAHCGWAIIETLRHTGVRLEELLASVAHGGGE